MSSRPGWVGVTLTALVVSFGVVLGLGWVFGTSAASSGRLRSIDVAFDAVRVGDRDKAHRVTVVRPEAGTVCASLPESGWTVPDKTWSRRKSGQYCRSVDKKKKAVRVHLQAHR